MKNLHSLLKRQLKRFNIDLKTAPAEIIGFIRSVDEAYHQSDIDRDMLERSLDLSSQELMQANSELRAIFLTFPDMFFRMDQEGKILDYKIGAHSEIQPPVNNLIGMKIDRIPVVEFKVQLIDAVKRVKETGELVSIQFKIRVMGKLNYFEARLLPLLETQIICIVRNITETKIAELELIKSEQQYRTVLESSPDPIVVYDISGTTEYANPAFTRLFGWTLQELKDNRIKFVPEEAKLETQQKIQRLKEGVDVHGFETHRYNRQGDVLDVIINASLRHNNEGKAIGSVVTFVNITERKKLEAELQFAMERAESANLAKTEFLTNMSHELRTPMHAILGFARLIVENFKRYRKEKVLDFVKEVFDAGQRLMLLLDDLLDLSKLEGGRVDFNFQKEKLSEVASLVIKETRSVSADKKIDIVFDALGFEDWVMIDHNKMVQVFRNLLINAIKFSSEESKILIRIVKQSGIIIFSIKDFGIGIPSDELETVFDKFVQSSKTKTGAGGTGLGLAICSEIIKAHEGRIWANNNPEGGTTFFVSLAAV
ncbi:PAS domain S-box protein [bacterium]|nr:PAS domain S-box protein [bacterium]